MREYKRGKKPVIHSTQLYNFMTCHKLMKLSEQIEMEPSKAMQDGLIIERMVFGDKDNLLPELLKGKRENTITEYQRKAEKLKPYFNNGEAFKKIEFTSRMFPAVLVGEVDYYTEEILFDLKVSGSHKYWESRNRKEDFLQAIYYNHIIYLQESAQGKEPKIRPFHYVVFAQDTELIKTYIVTSERIAKHNDWIEGLIDEVINEPFFSAYPDENKCLAQVYGVCRHLADCKEAQEYFSNIKKEVELA